MKSQEPTLQANAQATCEFASAKKAQIMEHRNAFSFFTLEDRHITCSINCPRMVDYEAHACVIEEVTAEVVEDSTASAPRTGGLVYCANMRYEAGGTAMTSLL